MMTFRMSRFLGAGALATLSLSAASAVASPNFPAALQKAANLECEPSCSICHQKDPGERGTATKPFAVSMADADLFPRLPDTVSEALEQLTAEEVDSDEDGVTDIEELTSGTDPNTEDGVLECKADVKYGCTHSPAEPGSRPGSSDWYVPLLLSALGASVLFRRRRQTDQ